MKKKRISPEKAAAMDQDAVLATKLAEHKNRSAGSKKAWVKIHAKRAAKAAAEAARAAVSENPAQALRHRSRAGEWFIRSGEATSVCSEFQRAIT